MRTYDRNGNGFTVTYSERDANRFAGRWPGSTVEGKGSFGFAGNGDLVELGGTAMEGDGDEDDWVAFSRDCQNWGEQRIGALRRRHTSKKNSAWDGPIKGNTHNEKHRDMLNDDQGPTPSTNGGLEGGMGYHF